MTTQAQPIRILTFTPVWQRPEIFKICLAGIKRLKKYDPKRFEIQPFFMISESWAARELDKLKYDYLFVQNQPLGYKKNQGLRYAIDNYKFDYILEIGSDDLITNDYLDLAEAYLQKGVHTFHPSNVHLISTETGKTGYWETGKILGLGRFISAKAIKNTINRFELWDNKGSRGMDTYSYYQLYKAGYPNTIIPIGNKVYTIDIKSKCNINQINIFMQGKLTADELIAYFPEAPLIQKLLP